MKCLLIGINSKYIHPNLAIRLLKANTKYDCEIVEYNIKDNINDIIKDINSHCFDVLAFSVYIWNVELIKEILKNYINRDFHILLGGPEVSYNTQYYFDNNYCDFIIKDEGEEAFDFLLKYLDGKKYLNEVPNLHYKTGFTFNKIVDIENIKYAYDLYDDVINKICYIETSRGCPYHCEYCMASLDNKVRFFSLDSIKIEIKKLLDRGAKTIKFLDRTFNADKKRFKYLVDFLIDNAKENTSYQFEITGDILDPDMITYINQRAKKHQFRFEIGIQSTNIEANKAVGRIQNNNKLFNNIKLIQDNGIIDLHLDLICGLPKEDYNSFIKTFNDVIKLKPKELQLGFLKLLYGTKLKEKAESLGYKVNKKAPYEIKSSSCLTESDIMNIHLAEDGLERFYNSGYFKNSMNILLDNTCNYFMLFYNLKIYYDNNIHNDLKDLFLILDNFSYMYYNNIYMHIHEALILDYLTYYNLKPKVWWKESITKKEKNEILRFLYQQGNINISLNDLYKYSLVVSLDNKYILAIYKPNSKQLIIKEKK